MAKKLNPFRPGQIVAPGMFVGRLDELLTLERILLQTRNGNPQHFLIRGEQGIGKSSLLLYLEHMAKGSIASIDNGSFRFLPVTVALDRSMHMEDVVKVVAREFQRALAPFHKVKELAKSVLDGLKGLEAFGMKYDPKERQPDRDQLVEETIAAVSHACSAMKGQVEGVVLLIDEADKAGPDAELGIFVKLLTERLTKRGVGNLVLGLAGLPTLVGKLQKSHESAPRVFEMMTLEPLTKGECIEVVKKGLEAARTAGGPAVTLTERGAGVVSAFSEGYPHFVQQFAFSAFDADTDNSIDSDDVISGALAPNGALHQLGVKYFESLYFDQIGSDEYRDVLRAMAEHQGEWVTKDDLRRRTKLKAHTVHNAITALKKRRIILPKPGQSGVYRLPTRTFATWIRAFTAASSGEAPA